ncbi:helix-turn-helix transcriptional regulator [Bacillus sp. EAC]|uniref:helix-turn-helix domain-containing protein n=1 Tax=Bacillus sp. EAC TaxID=1978338 RepID=UPI000B430B16|nr:helix-turn-helix transcriptional regulator [Bacillus sp. EAC]
MFEKGSIIQYFRQKNGLTQEELGHGICSKTHLSKIERGLTEVSDETISLLCARMGFDIDEEINKLKNVEKLLDTLQKQIIFQEKERALGIIDQLENQEFSYITPLHFRYLLLKTRQFIVDNKLEQAKKILFSKEIQNQKIPQLEENLLNHTLGIYYIQVNQIHNALDHLKKISIEGYQNLEIHYHLALVYHICDAYVSSYYHCQKAKEYFVLTNNYSRLLDTETLQLIILEDESHVDFSEIETKYQNLLEIAEMIKDKKREFNLLHNFAYQIYKKGDFVQAREMYLQAKEAHTTDPIQYLISHFGYVRCLVEGSLENNEFILKLIYEGKSFSKKYKQLYYEYLFYLYELKIEGNEMAYFEFLEVTLVPYLYEIKYKAFFDLYFEELTQYYLSINSGDKILCLLKKYKISISMGE